jgi:predicted phage terminase large subunit-like protein
MNPKNLTRITLLENKPELEVKRHSPITQESLFLPYQQQWFLNAPKSTIAVWEKSRRIGASWCDAALSTMTASRKHKPKDTYYISANKEMAEQYITDVSNFCLAFNILEPKIIIDEENDILVYRIRFFNGKKIMALSSAPKNIRGKQGDVVIDEAAFHENLDEMLKATIALTIWGGNIRLLSTHNGIENPFNKYLINNKGNPNLYIQKTTFRDAIAQGLYHRICQINSQEYSRELEDQYVKQTYIDYAGSANEELDVIPKVDDIDAIFKREWFKIARELPESFDVLLRAWDTASTSKDKSCFTVGILIGLLDESIYILEWDYIRANAAETNEFIINTAKKDGDYISVHIELEGGSQSRLWLENTIKKVLPRHSIAGISPKGSKLIRSLPVAKEAQLGNIYINDTFWTQDFLSNLLQYTGQKKSVPLISDTVDSLSLGVHCLKNFNSMLSLF